MDRKNLVEEVKSLIISAVHLHHVAPEEITESTSLYQDGLGLDSVDILEIVVAVEQKYGVKVKDAQAGKDVFRTVGAIVDFIQRQQ